MGFGFGADICRLYTEIGDFSLTCPLHGKRDLLFVLPSQVLHRNRILLVGFIKKSINCSQILQ